MKSQLLYFFFAAGLLFTQACDEIDNLSGGASAPEVTYSNTTFEATFFEAGNSATPSIDWNGAQGSISLGNPVDGLSVNSTTGQVQWTKKLPAGTHEVEVVVTNSEGQVVVPIVVENPLRGRFEGTYDGSFYYALIFKGDGTVDVEADDPANPYPGEGAYELLPNGTLSAEYEYDADPGRSIQVTGELDQSGSEAVLEGDWQSGSSTGTYQVNLE